MNYIENVYNSVLPEERNDAAGNFVNSASVDAVYHVSMPQPQDVSVCGVIDESAVVPFDRTDHTLNIIAGPACEAVLERNALDSAVCDVYYHAVYPFSDAQESSIRVFRLVVADCPGRGEMDAQTVFLPGRRPEKRSYHTADHGPPVKILNSPYDSARSAQPAACASRFLFSDFTVQKQDFVPFGKNQASYVVV